MKELVEGSSSFASCGAKGEQIWFASSSDHSAQQEQEEHEEADHGAPVVEMDDDADGGGRGGTEETEVETESRLGEADGRKESQCHPTLAS